MKRAALVAAAVLVVAACSDPEPEAADVPSTTTTEALTATVAPTTTTSTTAVAEPHCPGGPVGGAVDEGAALDGDFDGDGQIDTALSYLTDPTWRVRIDLADGGAVEDDLPTSPLDNAHVQAVTDLDGDGRSELWLQVGTGAATSIVGLYALDECDLEPVVLDGTPATFSIGGPVLLLQGVQCGGGTVTHLGATSDDGVTYTTLDLTYSLQNGELVRTGDESGTITSDDPDFAIYSAFDC